MVRELQAHYAMILSDVEENVDGCSEEGPRAAKLDNGESSVDHRKRQLHISLGSKLSRDQKGGEHTSLEWRASVG